MIAIRDLEGGIGITPDGNKLRRMGIDHRHVEDRLNLGLADETTYNG
jgi:hypothetical protein